VRQRYRENYERIAADHIAHWRATGQNPWQPDEQVRATNDSTAALVMRHSRPGDFVLDAGCGMGDLLSRVTGRHLHGCDMARPYLEVARERGIEAVYGELERMPYPADHFDVVTATDVLEHVIDLNAVVAELLRVLRPGGVLIVRVPSNEDLAPYLDPRYPYFFVHLRRFDDAGLRLLFTRVFECEVVESSPSWNGVEVNMVVRKP